MIYMDLLTGRRARINYRGVPGDGVTKLHSVSDQLPHHTTLVEMLDEIRRGSQGHESSED